MQMGLHHDKYNCSPVITLPISQLPDTMRKQAWLNGLGHRSVQAWKGVGEMVRVQA